MTEAAESVNDGVTILVSAQANRVKSSVKKRWETLVPPLVMEIRVQLSTSTTWLILLDKSSMQRMNM